MSKPIEHFDIPTGRELVESNYERYELQLTCLRSELAAVRADLAEAVAALKKYGHHTGRCKAFPATSEEQVERDCDCGLARIVQKHAPANTENVDG